MTSPDPEASTRAAVAGVGPATPLPPAGAAYWDFYDEVAAAQLDEWLPVAPCLVLDLSGDGPRWAQQVAKAGHRVVHVGTQGAPDVVTVSADTNELSWLADSSFDAVLAEGRALSLCLATEQTARELYRVLRPGGRLLLVVDSLLTGLARLADLGRWAELADVPSADCVLVPNADGSISRCFWPEELTSLLTEGGLEVQWVRSRSVLTPAAVERALEQSAQAMGTLVRTELALSAEREGEASGMHLVASALRPLEPGPLQPSSA